MRRIAVYAGSFDPPTEGHLDIVRRAAELVETLIVAVVDNPRKKPLFTAAEREAFLRGAALPANVQVDSFKGLLVDYLKAKDSRVVVRGLRAISDMEYEFQMASMNRHLYPELETVFLMPGEKFFFLSSTMVKEIAYLGGRLEGLVPPAVEASHR
jgi:pantetheine-phosphate adenylyltransferase